MRGARGEGRGARGRGAGLQQCTQLSFGEGSGTRSSGGHGRFLGHAVWLSGLRGGYCERRAHRYGLVQLGVLVVHLERGRLARGGRQVGVRSATRRRLQGGCGARSRLRRVCERGPVGHVAWRWLEAHTLIIEVVLKSSSESLISLPNHEGAGGEELRVECRRRRV